MKKNKEEEKEREIAGGPNAGKKHLDSSPPAPAPSGGTGSAPSTTTLAAPPD